MHPILFHVGPFIVYSYGVLLALGFLTSVLFLQRQLDKVGISRGPVFDILAVSAAIGLFGAKLIFVLTAVFDGHAAFDSALWLGSGVVFYGVPLFGLPMFYLLARRRNLPVWKLLDLLCLSFLLAHALGRIGCFMAGCCHGCPTSGPLGVRFQSDFTDLVARFQYVHPVQLYEAAGVTLLFAILLVVRGRSNLEGFLTALYLIGYGILRFVLEFYRGDVGRGEFGQFSTSQWISVFFVAIGFSLALSKSWVRKRQNL